MVYASEVTVTPEPTSLLGTEPPGPQHSDLRNNDPPKPTNSPQQKARSPKEHSQSHKAQLQQAVPQEVTPAPSSSTAGTNPLTQRGGTSRLDVFRDAGAVAVLMYIKYQLTVVATPPHQAQRAAPHTHPANRARWRMLAQPPSTTASFQNPAPDTSRGLPKTRNYSISTLTIPTVQNITALANSALQWLKGL